MSATFAITPPYDDKLFPIKAFDFEPRAPVELIAAIDTLRDDAFKTALAG
jgi:hypothetical protein